MSHTSEMSFTTASSSSNDVESMAIIGPQLDQSFETSSSGSDSESSSAGSSESDSDTGIGLNLSRLRFDMNVQNVLQTPVADRFQDHVMSAQTAEYRRIFDEIAPDGHLTARALEEGLHRSGLSHVQFQFVFDIIDVNRDGRIEFTEFLHFLTQNHSDPNLISIVNAINKAILEHHHETSSVLPPSFSYSGISASDPLGMPSLAAHNDPTRSKFPDPDDLSDSEHSFANLTAVDIDDMDDAFLNRSVSEVIQAAPLQLTADMMVAKARKSSFTGIPDMSALDNDDPMNTRPRGYTDEETSVAVVIPRILSDQSLDIPDTDASVSLPPDLAADFDYDAFPSQTPQKPPRIVNVYSEGHELGSQRNVTSRTNYADLEPQDTLKSKFSGIESRDTGRSHYSGLEPMPTTRTSYGDLQPMDTTRTDYGDLRPQETVRDFREPVRFQEPVVPPVRQAKVRRDKRVKQGEPTNARFSSFLSETDQTSVDRSSEPSYGKRHQSNYLRYGEPTEIASSFVDDTGDHVSTLFERISGRSGRSSETRSIRRRESNDIKVQVPTEAGFSVIDDTGDHVSVFERVSANRSNDSKTSQSSSTATHSKRSSSSMTSRSSVTHSIADPRFDSMSQPRSNKEPRGGSEIFDKRYTDRSTIRYIPPENTDFYEIDRKADIIAVFINKVTRLLTLGYTLGIQMFRDQTAEIIEVLKRDGAASHYAEDLVGVVELINLHHAKMYGKISSGTADPEDVVKLRALVDKAEAEVRVKTHIKVALEDRLKSESEKASRLMEEVMELRTIHADQQKELEKALLELDHLREHRNLIHDSFERLCDLELKNWDQMHDRMNDMQRVLTNPNNDAEGKLVEVYSTLIQWQKILNKSREQVNDIKKPNLPESNESVFAERLLQLTQQEADLRTTVKMREAEIDDLFDTVYDLRLGLAGPEYFELLSIEEVKKVKENIRSFKDTALDVKRLQQRLEKIQGVCGDLGVRMSQLCMMRKTQIEKSHKSIQDMNDVLGSRRFGMDEKLVKFYSGVLKFKKNIEGEELELKKMEELVEQSAYYEMYYSELQKYKDQLKDSLIKNAEVLNENRDLKNQLKHPKYSGKPPKELIDAISSMENTSRENLQAVVRHIGHVRRSINNEGFEMQLTMLQKMVENRIPRVDKSKDNVNKVLTEIDQKAEPNLREYRRIVAQKDKEIRAMRKRHLEISMKWDEKLKQKTQDVRRLQKTLEMKCDDMAELAWQYEKTFKTQSAKSLVRKNRFLEQEIIRLRDKLEESKENRPDVVNMSYFCGRQLTEKWIEEIAHPTFADLAVLAVVGPHARNYKCYIANLAIVSRRLREKLKDSSGRWKQKCDLADISERGFESILRYAYTNEVELNFENAFDTYLAAFLYEISPVRKQTLKFVKKHLSVHNVCRLLAAIAYSTIECQELSDEVYAFTDGQASAVISHQSFLRIPKKALIDLIGRDTFMCNETDLFLRSLEWTKVRSQEKGQAPKRIMKDILPHIRLPFVDPRIFSEIIIPMGLLSRQEVVDILAYHQTEDITNIQVRERGYAWQPRQPDLVFQNHGTSVSYDGASQLWRTVKLAGIELIQGVYIVDIRLDVLPDPGNDPDVLHLVRYGVGKSSRSIHTGTVIGQDETSWCLDVGNGRLVHNNRPEEYANDAKQGDFIRMRIEVDTGRVEYFKNGTSFGVAFEGVSGPLYVAASLRGNVQITLIKCSRFRA